MKSNSQILYERLKEIDLSVFQINLKEKLEISPILKKNMRYVGTEFERVFTTVLCEKYGLTSDLSRIYINKKIQKNNSNIEFKKRPSIEKNNLFKLDELLENLEYFKYFSKDSSVLSFQKEIKLFIKDLLFKINYEKFKPKKYILTKIKFHTKFESFPVGGLFCEMDLIIDDKIIDIKTDTVLKLNKDYVVQLLYYYFLLNYSYNASKDLKCFLNKLKINKICLYYACFDILIEFDLKKIFKNSSIINEINLLIHNSFISYNFNLKELIHSVVFNQTKDKKFFEDIENIINENHLNLFKRHIDERLNFEYEIENLNLTSERLLQIIKLNLSIIEFKKTHNLNLSIEILIKEYLMTRFRYSLNKESNKGFAKLDDKHLYMGMSDYSRMTNALNSINYYNECLKDKNIQKSSKEFYEGNKEGYYNQLTSIENKNKNDFIFFIKNWTYLYLEITKQKYDKILENNEFNQITDVIIELLKYEIKTNHNFNNEYLKIIIELIIKLEGDLKNKLLTKKQFTYRKYLLISKLIDN